MGRSTTAWWWGATGALMGPLTGSPVNGLAADLSIQSVNWLLLGRRTGERHYEVSDHLGNVLAMLLDRKVGGKASLLIQQRTTNYLFESISFLWIGQTIRSISYGLIWDMYGVCTGLLRSIYGAITDKLQPIHDGKEAQYRQPLLVSPSAVHTPEDA